uniref:Large ribosomal subunit protein eL22 n=1 Tax=Neovison vison TaxID=452646 RepID=A0A8C7BWH1_NEOVI
MDGANFEQFLKEVNGRAGNLGGEAVTIKRSKSKISVTSEVSSSKSPALGSLLCWEPASSPPPPRLPLCLLVISLSVSDK